MGGGKQFLRMVLLKARGVAIFTSHEWYKKIRNVQKCDQGRYIILDVIINNDIITLVALYAPNEDNITFFHNIAHLLKERSEHKILIGDYNLTLNVELDRCNTYCNNNKAKEEVENMMNQYHLRDVWRIHYQDKKEFSWIKSNSKPKKASRIDFALISAGLDQKVE